jgi:hypothetical protein
MATVFAKLNPKDHKQIVVLDSPSSFESELAALEGVTIQCCRAWRDYGFHTIFERFSGLSRSHPSSKG